MSEPRTLGTLAVLNGCAVKAFRGAVWIPHYLCYAGCFDDDSTPLEAWPSFVHSRVVVVTDGSARGLQYV